MKKRIILIAVIGLCLLLLTLTAGAETVHSGTWGKLSWTLDDAGLLTISGTGAMNSFNESSPYNLPTSTEAWQPYRWDIKSVKIGKGVTSNGDYAVNY